MASAMAPGDSAMLATRVAHRGGGFEHRELGVERPGGMKWPCAARGAPRSASCRPPDRRCAPAAAAHEDFAVGPRRAEHTMTPDSPRLQALAIQTAIRASQARGPRSSRAKRHASSRCAPAWEAVAVHEHPAHRSATRAATVLLPEPDTPITTRTCPPSCVPRSRPLQPILGWTTPPHPAPARNTRPLGTLARTFHERVNHMSKSTTKDTAHFENPKTDPKDCRTRSRIRTSGPPRRADDRRAGVLPQDPLGEAKEPDAFDDSIDKAEASKRIDSLRHKPAPPERGRSR